MRAGCLQSSDFRSADRYANPVPKTLIHVVERHQPENGRVLKAVESWNRIYDSGGMFPFQITRPRRTAKLLGDPRDLPYLKEFLAAGIRIAEPDSIIVFTNSDIVLHPETPLAITKHMQAHDCVCGFRITLDTIPSTGSHEYWRSLGQPDFGRDLFAFKAQWLVDNWGQIPDFLIGEQEWDLVMACLIRQQNGVSMLHKTDLATFEEESEIPLGYVIHQRHVGGWLSPQARMSPGKLYNVSLANKWYAEHDLKHFTLPL